MIVNHEFKVNAAASREPGRYTMNAILLRTEGDKPKLYATDGCILSGCDIELEGGEELPNKDYLIPVEAFDEMMKGRATELRTITILDDTRVLLRRGGTLQEVECMGGEFPTIDRVISDAISAGSNRVRLNRKLLLRLLKSVGSDDLMFTISDDQSPMLVHGLDLDGSPVSVFGIIMPKTIKKKRSIPPIRKVV